MSILQQCVLKCISAVNLSAAAQCPRQQQGHVRNTHLGAVSVRARVGHRQHARAGVGQLEVLRDA